MKTSNINIIGGTIESAASLEWRARNLAKGLNLGKHKSKKLGVGMEFNQFRNYVQGDDIRLLDWKMYAKTGQYFIRQSDVETIHNLHVSIDNSKSMDYVETGISKIDLAKIITATLSYIMGQQADQFSWQSGSVAFAKSQGLKNWRRSLLALDKLESDDQPSLISQQKTRTKDSGIHLWITDLYLDKEAFDQFVANNYNPNRELIIFHLIGRNEEVLNFDASSKFIDLESGIEMHVNAQKIAKQYQDALCQHIHQIKRTCQNKGIVYRKIYLQADLKNELRSFLMDYNSLTQ